MHWQLLNPDTVVLWLLYTLLCIYQPVIAHTDLLGLTHFLNTFEALEPNFHPVAALCIAVALPALVCEAVSGVQAQSNRKSQGITKARRAESCLGWKSLCMPEMEIQLLSRHKSLRPYTVSSKCHTQTCHDKWSLSCGGQLHSQFQWGHIGEGLSLWAWHQIGSKKFCC